MDLEDLEPRKQKPKPKDLDALGVEELEAYIEELAAKEFKYSRPQAEETEFGTVQATVTDPSGNRLTFYRNLPQPDSD